MGQWGHELENSAASYVLKQLKTVQLLHHGQVYLYSAFYTKAAAQSFLHSEKNNQKVKDENFKRN